MPKKLVVITVLLLTQRLVSLGQTTASNNPTLSQKKLKKMLDVEQPLLVARTGRVL